MTPILKLDVCKQPCLDQETDLELTNLFYTYSRCFIQNLFLHLFSVNLLEIYEIVCTTRKIVNVPK